MVQVTPFRMAYKPLFLVAVWTVVGLAVLAVGLKSFFLLEHEYICEAKIDTTIRTFISEARIAKFDSFNNRSAFVSNEEFQEFQKLRKPYSLTIEDWTLGDVAHVLVKFESQPPYGFTVAPKEEHAIICWGKEYKVLTVRR